MTRWLPAALFDCLGTGIALALDLTPLRHRPRVARALRAVVAVPALRWGAVLPLAALGGAFLAAQRWHARRVARREMRSGRW